MCCEDNKHKETIDKNQAVKMVALTIEKAEKALNNALDIRKFEIELYWKRASYFWTFIGLIYAAFCGVLVKMDIIDIGFRFQDTQVCILYLISSAGLCLSLAWFFVNKGSKYWQENWENLISLLEDDLIGPSYKIILHRPDTKGCKAITRTLLEPEPYSVSKINQLLSLFNVIIWICISAWALFELIQRNHIPFIAVTSFILSLAFFILLIWKCKSNLLSHEVTITERGNDSFKIAN